MVEDGYEFFAKRQLVTLFSAPNYCGEFDNAGAMMSVDETLMCSFQVSMLANFERKSFLVLEARKFSDWFYVTTCIHTPLNNGFNVLVRRLCAKMDMFNCRQNNLNYQLSKIKTALSEVLSVVSVFYRFLFMRAEPSCSVS